MNNLYLKERTFSTYSEPRKILNYSYLKEKISHKVFFKLFVVIGLTYQLLELTIDYTEYETAYNLLIFFSY